MITVGIYIKDSVTLEYNRVELFSDEKISVNSSIQNVNDISKTYTDFSQTFTVPASKQNNKIFRHWYENSNDNGFSTLVKADAYIEIDTILFRSGKIQLESANVKDGQPQDYSITFIGALGSLKDKFNGLYLKDLTDTTYDFNYTANEVLSRVVDNMASRDVMFPLISSNRVWNVSPSVYNDNAINWPAAPIRYNELFPAIRLSAVLNMISNDSNILNLNFNGSFLSDARFTNAYLYLKNADEFKITSLNKIDFTTKGNLESVSGVTVDLTDNSYTRTVQGLNKITITPQAGYTSVPYTIKSYRDDVYYTSYVVNSGGTFVREFNTPAWTTKHSFYIETNQSFQFIFKVEVKPITINPYSASATMATQTITSNISIVEYMPEIKIEDFFSGLLKMFNLTCYSTDGINYTVEQLESYYTSGQIRDITKYIKSDNVNLNRVKTYKKINFEYEKSESLINVGFNSANGIEYGSLFYNTNNDGDEYNIKLPFEDLNFSNLFGSFQVGYCLKTDYQKYIPKPIILYDYNPNGTIDSGFTFYTSEATSGNGDARTQYKAFGQEYYDGTNTYSLNFNIQQSTLTNEVISNSLYQQYYENYLANIFDSKARLIKVSGILPTSLLTTLKLNDRLVIRDKRYLINTFTTDLTTGEVQFELLTDFREVSDTSLVLNLDAGNPLSYPGTGTLWTDLSGNNNNGTLVNGATFDPANGGSIVFDGVDDYVNCDNASNLQITVGTISVWVKTTTPGNSYRGIIVKQFSWGLFVQDGVLITYDWGMPANMGTRTTGINISDGTWKNITMSFTETVGTPSNNAIIYLNGNAVLTTTIKYVNNTINLELCRGGTSGVGASQLLNGNISEAKIYNRVLSSTEVLENFNATKGRYGL